MVALWDISIAFTSLLQSLGGWLAAPMALFSFLGQAEFYLMFLPALYWCWNARLGLRLTLVLLLSATLNDAFKVALCQPRPYWIDTLVRALAHETSFGLPSGHAQNAVAVWGYLAMWIKRRWAWIVAVLLILLIGLSRLYLGVHFAHDVALGWLIGMLLLLAFLRTEEGVSAWIARQALWQQLVIALVGSWLLLLIGALGHLAATGWLLPLAWQENALTVTGQAIDPQNPEGLLSGAGMVLGLGIGWAWTHNRGGFCSDGVAWKRLLRYLGGVIGMALLWYGMRLLYAGQQGLVEHGLRYLRATLVGIWTTGGAPEVFVRLRLTTRASREVA